MPSPQQPPHALPVDSLRAALDAVFAAPRYDWAERPLPLRWLAERWAELGEWLRALQSDNPRAFELLAWGLVALLALVFLHAGWIMLRTLQASARSEARGAGPAAAARRDAAWYQAEADGLAAAGRYSEALAPAFLALALGLDGAGAVRFHPSKTPGEYAREARLPSEGRARLASLVRELYGASFGRAPFGAVDWDRWRDAARGLASGPVEAAPDAPAH